MRLVLDPDEATLRAAAELRTRVFVDEQGVDPAIERDGRDGEARHVVVLDDAGAAVATGRMRRYGDDAVKLERIAVCPDHRGLGLGVKVMRALEDAARRDGIATARLASQESAVGFYLGLGYVCFGEPFVEADIVHRWMALPLRPSGASGTASTG